MPTIAETWVQQGHQQGLQQGLQQGIIIDAQEMVIEALVERFGVIPQSIVKKIKKMESREILKGLLRKAIKAADLEEFKKALVGT